MLEIKRTTNLSGVSKIDGVVAERYTAFINESDPTAPSVTRRVVDQELYDANKALCREDQDVFDDTVDEIVKEAEDALKKKADPLEDEDVETVDPADDSTVDTPVSSEKEELNND